MSRTRVYSQDTLYVMERFFIAIEECRQRKLIPTYTQYFADNGIDKGHFFAQRKWRHKGFFEIGWVVPIVRDCGVSARWLLTGQGTMFTKRGDSLLPPTK